MMAFTLKELGLVLPLLLGKPSYLLYQEPRAISFFSLNSSWHKVWSRKDDAQRAFES